MENSLSVVVGHLLCVCRVVYPGFGTWWGSVCQCWGSFISLQSKPWYPGQHLHSNSVTVLKAILYVGRNRFWYLKNSVSITTSWIWILATLTVLAAGGRWGVRGQGEVLFQLFVKTSVTYHISDSTSQRQKSSNIIYCRILQRNTFLSFFSIPHQWKILNFRKVPRETIDDITSLKAELMSCWTSGMLTTKCNSHLGIFPHCILLW